MTNLFCIRPKGFNVGNDVIFMAMQHYLYEAFGRVVNLISLPATSRYESQAKAGLTARTVHDINQFGDGVIVGGGNLYENGELEVDVNALSRLDVPLMLFSLSMGRIYDRRSRLVRRTDAIADHITKALNEKAGYSLARDRATLKYLHDLGCADAQLGGCPTIALNQLTERLPHLPQREQPGVLISIRNPDLMNIPLVRQAQVRSDIIRMIEFFRGQGLGEIRLLCHDHRDIPFAATFPGIEYIYTGDAQVYLSMLRACNLNVTYRLHSCLPCLSYQRPTIYITYDERAISLMDTIGMGESHIDMMQTADVPAAVADAYGRISQQEAVLEEARPAWDELSNTMSDSFKSFAEEVSALQDSVRETGGQA